MPDAKEGQTLPMPGYNWKHMPLVSALVYSFISIAITLFNKAVLTSYSESPTLAHMGPLHAVQCSQLLLPSCRCS
jgi:hypothetical protein